MRSSDTMLRAPREHLVAQVIVQTHISIY